MGRRKHDHVSDHAFFGDEDAAQLRAELDELRTELRSLTERVQAQFTTIAAHAEISRQQIEFARDEARADLDRSRDTLIGLIEQLRGERAGYHVAGTAPGPSKAATNERFERSEQRIADLAETVERCFSRQNQLADTMAAFLDTVLAEQRGEPVAGLSLR